MGYVSSREIDWNWNGTSVRRPEDEAASSCNHQEHRDQGPSSNAAEEALKIDQQLGLITFV
jgi:hypothetical protein